MEASTWAICDPIANPCHPCRAGFAILSRSHLQCFLLGHIRQNRSFAESPFCYLSNAICLPSDSSCPCSKAGTRACLWQAQTQHSWPACTEIAHRHSPTGIPDFSVLIAEQIAIRWSFLIARRSRIFRQAPDYSSNLCPPKIWSIWLF